MNNLMAKFVMLAALASMAVAADVPSVERGEELFTSPELGTTGKSCSSCHSKGKGLERAAAYNELALGETINNCITGPLKGRELDAASNDMKSLIIYVKSLRKPVKSSMVRV